jgi:hypothetical protein
MAASSVLCTILSTLILYDRNIATDLVDLVQVTGRERIIHTCIDLVSAEPNFQARSQRHKLKIV